MHVIIYDCVTGSSLVTLASHHFGFLLFSRLASELCSERQVKVKQSICTILRFKVILTYVLYNIVMCEGTPSWHVRSKQTTVPFLGRYISLKYPYVSYAHFTEKSGYTLFRDTRTKESGFRLLGRLAIA